ncbi:YeeE/YedE thiosulfate transporter family protein [Brevundimonas sp.]|uniref:YeeE/YedE thiosulfate transporter family protein n=1 Tax=Brevundimonas sp. TaxID=1871086 RepID=UPI0035620671
MFDPLFAVAICGLAFWMGYSVNQGGTCAVATAHEILHHRRPLRFIGLLAASATAALVATALVWSGIAAAMHAGTVGVTPTLLLGAVVFGCGALVNDACLLGSLGRLGDGELRLMLLPAGLAAGFLLAGHILGEATASGSSLLSTPGQAAIVGLTVWAVVLVLSLAVIARRGGRRQVSDQGPLRGHERWPLALTMVVLGLTGGALFVTAPAWTFTDLVRDSLPLAMAMARPDGIAALAVAATVCGAIASSLRRRAWRVRRITARGAAKTLAGGALMGVGVAAIPGGNDGLVLAAIPALSPGGIAAYLVITMTIIVGLWFKRLRSARDGQIEADRQFD